MFIQLCYFVCKESKKVIAESYVILSVSVYKQVSILYSRIPGTVQIDGDLQNIYGPNKYTSYEL